ncbi:MAG: LysR family transcriptional regulator [Rhodobacteraceae bacterium]|nr:LysR family transcriptional regulator [Paracoccaceae bacterium]MCF8515741.1 LysR family transcriptional regulator [Paracoccaceae bacterium]MCF8519986.1 LysR family transcriptional regulator [Paracoccaceae bacterium]
MSDDKYKITLKQLEIFQAIVLAGSFTRATALTNLAQPTLSQQLANLEKELKTQLIKRGKKSSIEITPAGDFWLTRAAEILNLVESALTTHQAIYVDQGITIGFGTTPSLQGRFDELISTAALNIPEIKALNIHSFLNSRQVAEALLSHRINLGIASRETLDEQKSSLNVVKLYDDKIVWAVPRAIPISDVVETIRRGKCVGGHTGLERYVTLGQTVPWHKRTTDWYRSRLPFAQPFFGVATHLSAVQIAASGFATCHTPMTLIPNLPNNILRRLTFYDIGELAREVCMAYPKHLMSIKSFVNYSREVQRIIDSEFTDTTDFISLETELAAAVRTAAETEKDG